MTKQAPCVSLMNARRWNYAKIQYIENHLSQTVQIPFSEMVRRSREANAACCKVLLAYTVLPATFTSEQSKPAWPLDHSLHLCLFCHPHQDLDNDRNLRTALFFCAVQPFGCGHRSGERRAVKQFPPSESHSDPHRGNCEADPCQAVTANTFKQRVRALGRLAIREPNQQFKKKKNDFKI